jgi:hypothetical protein
LVILEMGRGSQELFAWADLKLPSSWDYRGEPLVTSEVEILKYPCQGLPDLSFHPELT